MPNKIFTLDASRFSDEQKFYDEVERVLTKGLGWKIGRNLDAFNDVLRGDFGCFEDDEPIMLAWKNTAKSKADLGHSSMVLHLNEILKECHPSNIPDVEKRLLQAKANEGPTLFDEIVEIIRSHPHITLDLK